MNEPMTVNTLIDYQRDQNEKRERQRQADARDRSKVLSEYILREIDRANEGWKPGFPVSLWRPKK